jgi:Fe-S cluster biogenesis protein NfuA
MVSIEKVEAAIDSIRPYMMADGGNIRVLEVSPAGEVKVELLGACGECPMSAMTLKAGVEDAIRQALPEITRVVAINPAEAVS